MEPRQAVRVIQDMTTSVPHAGGESDAQLIRLSLERPAAFEGVFDRHFQTVHAFADRRVGPDLAEEVAAETFARAYRRRDRYDGAYPDALPWLLGIASNLIRRHHRAERRRLAAYARAARHDPPAAAPEVAGELLEAVARLPRSQRDVLLLYAWADLGYQQIARALDLPVGTVRSRLARARSRLGGGADVLPARPVPPIGGPKEPSRV
jgi:RNA polymerase sigma-70 factor (ECF subfamily)